MVVSYEVCELIIPSVAVLPVRFVKLHIQITCVKSIELKLFPVF